MTKPIMQIDEKFVRCWQLQYNTEMDEKYYDPYISAAREGCREALRKVTEWKNVGSDDRPMRFNRHQGKEKSFQFLLKNIDIYLADKTGQILRADFARKAPVWGPFWHHVLYGTPIFDVYTNMAFRWDSEGTILSKKEAVINVPKQWRLYDEYCHWFLGKLRQLQISDPSISDRNLDRACIGWGRSQQKASL